MKALIEPDALYWALLDDRDQLLSSELKSTASALLPESLYDMVQPQIPAPLDGLHVACVCTDDARILCCAIEPESLKKLVDSHGTGLLTLTPRQIPPELATDQGCARRLNLLVGPFEPMPISAARRTIKRTFVACIIAACALALVGVELRTRACNIRSHQHAAMKAEALRSTGHGTIEDLTREESRLRAMNRSAERSNDTLTAIQSISTVIGAWPRAANAPFVRTDSIQAAPDAIALSIFAESPDDAERLIDALRRINGWTLAQPQYSRPTLSPVGSAARSSAAEGLTLRLRLTKQTQPQASPVVQPAQRAERTP